MRSKSSLFANRCKGFMAPKKSLGSSVSSLTSAAPDGTEPKVVRDDLEWNSAKPFKSLPGPGVWDFIKWFLPGGELYNKPISQMVYIMERNYGPISRFPAMLGRPPMVFTFDPKLTQKVYRAEGVWPQRRGLDTFVHYRKNIRPDVFKDLGGLVSDQGETWYKLRTKVNPVMMQPRTVSSYAMPVDAVARDFVKKMGLLRDKNDELPANFATEMGAWALESIGLVALDRRLGAIDLKREPDTEQLIRAVKDFLRLSFELDIQPSLWYYFPTKGYRELMAAYDVMTNVVMKNIDAKIAEIDKSIEDTRQVGEESVLQKLLKIDRHYAIVMTFDMLFAGIDTTSNAVVNLLYLLAKHPEKQEKLRAEIFELLPNVDSEITQHSLDHSPYFRGALKESMRLLPLNPANMRGSGEDIVLNGYQIPKNTDILMGNIVLQTSDTYFANSDEFQPERFMRDADGNYPPNPPDYSPFSFLPFGFGTRMCIGKRFAELEIQMLTFRILREYRVEWHHGPMEYASSLILSASSPLRFRMVRLEK